MSSRRETRLLDRATDTVVEAVLVDGMSKDEVIRAHLDWQPVRVEALTHLLATGQRFPEHWHWDWSRKAAKLDLAGAAYHATGIEHGGQIQGMMMVSTIERRARIASQAGKPVLYVEYIESAPWNLQALVENPRFSGVGVALLEAAIQFSAEEEFAGRIGLHSLPQSESFYGRYMQDLGIDQGHHERLRYFEMAAEEARNFLGGLKS